jgi:hypothetical protein
MKWFNHIFDEVTSSKTFISFVSCFRPNSKNCFFFILLFSCFQFQSQLLSFLSDRYKVSANEISLNRSQFVLTFNTIYFRFFSGNFLISKKCLSSNFISDKTEKEWKLNWNIVLPISGTFQEICGNLNNIFD